MVNTPNPGVAPVCSTCGDLGTVEAASKPGMHVGCPECQRRKSAYIAREIGRRSSDLDSGKALAFSAGMLAGAALVGGLLLWLV